MSAPRRTLTFRSIRFTNTNSRACTPNSHRAFTLVEILICLGIIAIVTATLVPSYIGIVKQTEAREPLTELVDMARTVRSRAINLRRPYQIGLDEKGAYAAPFFHPYGLTTDYDQLKQEIESRQTEASILAAGAERYGALAGEATPDPDATFLERYEWPEGLRVKVRFWGDSEWEDLSGARFRRWVFQPSGLSRPLMIRFENDTAFFEARFSAMTGEVEDESSAVK